MRIPGYRLLKRSITLRTFLLVLAISGLFFALVLGTFYYTSVDALKRQAHDNAAASLDMLRDYLDLTLESMNQSMYLFMRNNVLFSGDNEAITQYFQEYREVSPSFAVKLLIEDDTLLAIDNTMLLSSLSVDTAFYQSLSQRNRMVMTAPYYSPLGAGRTVALVRSMVDAPSGRELLLVAEIRTRELFKLIRQRFSPYETLVVLTPQGETVYVDYTAPLLGQLKKEGYQLDISDALREALMDTTQSVSEVALQGKRLIVERLRYNQQWNLYTLLDSQQFYQPLQQMTRRYAILALLATLCLAGLSLIISARVTSPIKTLAKRADQLHAQDGALLPPSERQDEIGSLERSFNGLLARLHAANAQHQATEQERYALEYKVLQSQIQPHFLFNIHVCVDALLEQGNTEMARQMLYALDGLLRASIDKTDALIPLGEEIGYLHRYVDLQQMRGGDRFDFTVDAWDAFADVKVPRLLLQPIVENAIYHGLSGIDWRGEIRLSFVGEAGALHIFVEDNGKGIDPDALEALHNGEVPQTARSGMVSIGLYNVRQRIHSVYGADYGLYIHSRKNIGTTVEMTIALPFGQG